ncbi:MAG: hypothetical protein H7A36_06930 [Chlamydiales bacterium]|nr:hypothetical protein [Chlamydiales bacterium]
MALFNEAREKISSYFRRFVRLRIFLYIAQLESASGLSPAASLASAKNISFQDLPFMEQFCAPIYLELAKHNLEKTCVSLSLYDLLKALPFPNAICYANGEEGFNVFCGLLALIAPHTEDPAVALQKEREVFAHWLECASQNDEQDNIDWAQHNTADIFCRLASLRRLACTEAPETVVQAIQEFDEANLSSAINTALSSAIQHNRVELMQLLLTTFLELFQEINTPLRNLALRFFPALIKNNPIPILSAEEILNGMQSPTPENRRSNYHRIVVAVRNGHFSLAIALLRNMRPHLPEEYYTPSNFIYDEDSTLYSCSDPEFPESKLWLPLGSTEQ